MSDFSVGLVIGIALCTPVVSFAWCTPAETQAQSELDAVELACVEVSPTRPASRDCRNAVRAVWAQKYGVDAGRLEGGSE